MDEPVSVDGPDFTRFMREIVIAYNSSDSINISLLKWTARSPDFLPIGKMYLDKKKSLRSAMP